MCEDKCNSAPINLLDVKFHIESPEYRTSFMKDRDRIMYSKPFRRLAGKTQVYAAGYDDHARNRLTHTLEVSQIARTIAVALELDIHLVEAIALGHDLGHTAFGHAGERQLHEILNFNNDKINRMLDIASLLENPIILESKGFKHNLQGVRIIIDLEGDNLLGEDKITPYTLVGIWYHSKVSWKKDGQVPSHYQKYVDKLKLSNVNENIAWSLEGLVVAMADEIAQRHHDLEDAVVSHFLSQDEVIIILSNLLSESNILEKNKHDYSYIRDTTTNGFLYKLSGFIVNLLINDLVSNSKLLLKNINFNAIKLIPNINIEEAKMLINYSDPIKTFDENLQKKLKNVILNSQSVKRMDSKGRFIIRRLVQAYITTPQQMPNNTINAIYREYIRNQLSAIRKEIQEIQKKSENIKSHSEISNVNEYVIDKNMLNSSILKRRNTLNDQLKILERILINEDFNIFKSYPDAREALESCLKSEAKDGDAIKPEIKLCEKEEHHLIYNKLLFKISLIRVICDYIAGMTDSYAENEYRKLYALTSDIMG